MVATLIDLVQVDDVGVLHLGQDVDLLLDVLSGHAPPGREQPLLLDELGCILRLRVLLHYAMNHGKLATVDMRMRRGGKESNKKITLGKLKKKKK